MKEDLIYLATAILLPIVPAYILYRWLPARTAVKGPFKGLNIQLSGAFAAYFLVILMTLGFVYSRRPQADAPYEVWKVTGQASFDPAYSSEVSKELLVSVVPPSVHISPDGFFTIAVVVPCAQGRPEFPDVVLGHPLYRQATLHLGEDRAGLGQHYRHRRDDSMKEIQILDRVVLEPKKGEYRPQGVLASAPEVRPAGQ